MKTLDEIKKEILILKDKILCQNIGNDSYYMSPLFHKQLLQLEALEHEADVLNGKSAPIIINLDEYPPQKQEILKKIIKENGTTFANNYKDLSLNDLIFLMDINKKN